MKPSRLFVINLFIFFLVYASAIAQDNWWRYGVDEMVVIKIRQQPKIIDTLGQTFIIAETDYGGIRINKMPIGVSYYSEEDLDEFYDAFLKTITKSGETEVLSHQVDTIQNLRCMRYIFRRPSMNIEGHGMGVIAGNYAYGFQFVYSPEDIVNASIEREYFFNNIEFNTGVASINQAKRLGYIFGMGIGFISLAVVPLILIALVIVAVSYYRRKKRSA